MHINTPVIFTEKRFGEDGGKYFLQQATLMESLVASDDHSVIVLDSAEKEIPSGGGSCAQLQLPRCDTWEEFLEGGEELVAVSRKMK